MRTFVNIMLKMGLDFRVWFRINFIYPFRKDYSRIRSIVPAGVKLGHGVIIEEDVRITYFLKEIGHHVYISNNTYLSACSSIGSFSSISNGVKIGLGDHPLNYISSSPLFYVKKRGWLTENTYVEGAICAEIGNDVVVSANALILAGVKVGTGAVIGAGAVVTKDVPPYAIVAGVPAKVIRYRFGPEMIAKLLESRWWERSDEEIKKAGHFNEPEKFLSLLTSGKS